MQRRYMKSEAQEYNIEILHLDFHTEWLRHQSKEIKLRKSPQTGDGWLVFLDQETLTNTSTFENNNFSPLKHNFK